MRVFATYKGTSYLDNNRKNEIVLNWDDVCNDAALPVVGQIYTPRASFLSPAKLRMGNRYLMECGSIDGRVMSTVIVSQQVPKNKRCDLMRKALGTFHFIRGQYKGKTMEDIDKNELIQYTLWLAKDCKNEATIKNCLEILEILHNEGCTES